MAGVELCYNSIHCKTLDDLVAAKLLDALSPVGVELSLRVIEDEHSRREQLDALHVHRVAQTRHGVDGAERIPWRPGHFRSIWKISTSGL
jgi:hypothetical protein